MKTTRRDDLRARNDAFDVVAFDADDTLWHNETRFQDTHAEYSALLSRYHDAAWIEDRLYRTEMRNLEHYGYGVKSFMLSMVETAVELTEGRISGDEIKRILDLGRAMLEAPVSLLDGVESTLDALANAHELMLITKGDLLDQESKIERSGLRDYFARVEVVSRKDPHTYSHILARHSIDPRRFVMVGNSLRSDVLPVLEIGGWAVYIPYPAVWEHEKAESEPDASERYARLERIAELPSKLRTLGTPRSPH